MREHYTHSPIQEAFDALERLSADEQARLKAEARAKALSNEVTLLNEARRKGEKIGEERGQTRALEAVALKLLRAGEPADKIADLTDMPLDRVEALKSKL